MYKIYSKFEGDGYENDAPELVSVDRVCTVGNITPSEYPQYISDFAEFFEEYIRHDWHHNTVLKVIDLFTYEAWDQGELEMTYTVKWEPE